MLLCRTDCEDSLVLRQSAIVTTCKLLVTFKLFFITVWCGCSQLTFPAHSRYALQLFCNLHVCMLTPTNTYHCVRFIYAAVAFASAASCWPAAAAAAAQPGFSLDSSCPGNSSSSTLAWPQRTDKPAPPSRPAQPRRDNRATSRI